MISMKPPIQALQRLRVTACARTASHQPTTDPLTTPTALRPTLDRVDERLRAHPAGCLRQSVSLRSARPHRPRRSGVCPALVGLGTLGDITRSKA